MPRAIRYGQWLLLSTPLLFIAIVVAFPDDAELRVELPALCVASVAIAYTARAASFGAAVGRLAAVGAAVLAALAALGWLIGAALSDEGADTFESVAFGATIVGLGAAIGGGAAVLFGGAAYAYSRCAPSEAPRLALAAVALSPFALLLLSYGLGPDWLGLAITVGATVWLIAALREARDVRLGLGRQTPEPSVLPVRPSPDRKLRSRSSAVREWNTVVHRIPSTGRDVRLPS